jgi:hypothetical protein
MNKIKELLKDIAKDPGAYIALLVMVALVAGAVYVLLTSGAGNWRWLYCQSSVQHSIECTAKGWW